VDLPIGKATKKGLSTENATLLLNIPLSIFENPEEQITYRLITSLLDIQRFPAFVVGEGISSTLGSRKYD
jgi:hypothetical protein